MTDHQKAVLEALEQAVAGVPDARPLDVEAKDLRTLCQLTRAQQTDLVQTRQELAAAKAAVDRLRPPSDNPVPPAADLEDATKA